MSSHHHPLYLFEHPGFNDLDDAFRRSRLCGFEYRADHARYALFCASLQSQVSSERLAAGLSKPLDAVPDNTALYILTLTESGRSELWPTLLAVALSHGFCVLDDSLAECHTPAGIWTDSGFRSTGGE